jgi:hypothetical protein
MGTKHFRYLHLNPRQMTGLSESKGFSTPGHLGMAHPVLMKIILYGIIVHVVVCPAAAKNS